MGGTGIMQGPPVVNGGAGTGNTMVNMQAGTTGGGSGTMAVPPVPAGTPVPCAVQQVLKQNCQSCHGERLIGGAPMRLVTHEDFTKDYKALTSKSVMGQTMKVHQLAKLRLNSTAEPMPPGGQMAPADKAMLDSWLAGGAIAGTAQDATCMTQIPQGGAGGTGGMKESECDAAAAYEDVVARDGETCYEFKVHGSKTTVDDTPYMIQPGENYEQFYYDVPWQTGVQGTRFGANFDNEKVLHHWLLFTTSTNYNHGYHETVIGTLIGDTAQLLGGWAVGGCNVEFPPHMGLELPPAGGKLNVQWHFYNNGTAPEPDNTSVVVCTVPAGTRPNTGSLTWLGTENFYGPFGMPPGMHDFEGTCPNDSGADINIWGFWPHMHELGRHMKSVVNRADGTMQTVFDKPFDFNKQIHYENRPELILKPGDTITSTCTFQNDTGGNVAFGPSTKQEMCYQFAFSYPARALDNGTGSLIGASNVCW